MRAGFLSLLALPLLAGTAEAATPAITEDLRLLRDQTVQASRPCDRGVEELGKLMDQANQAASRAAADSADRACEQARSAFATLKPPGSLPGPAQEQIREMGRKMASGMSSRRKAITAARDYLIKSDKPTAELYRKRMIEAQNSIGQGIDILKKVAAEQSVDLSQ